VELLLLLDKLLARLEVLLGARWAAMAAIFQGFADAAALRLLWLHCVEGPAVVALTFWLLLLLLLQVFSQLGGLQLDKDVRSLVAAAGELTTRPIRDKFARLTQVGTWLHPCKYMSQPVTLSIVQLAAYASINACVVHAAMR
jgi:hypothetical protein